MIAHVFRLMLFSAILLLIESAYQADLQANPPWVAAGRWTTCVAYAPDGKSLATARIVYAPYAPDGKSVAATRNVGDGTIRDVSIWDVKTGRLKHRIVLPHHNYPKNILFSPDSRLLAVTVMGGFESEIELYNVENGKRLRVLPVDWTTHDHRPATGFGSIISANFSPDGRTLAIATFSEKEPGDPTDTNRVLLMSVATGKVTHILGNDRVGICAAAFSPDGKSLITLDNPSKITFRDSRTGRRRGSNYGLCERAEGENRNIQISADGKLLLINDNQMSLYSAHGLRLLWERKPTAGIAAAAFSPDGGTLLTHPASITAQQRQQFFIRFCDSRSGHVLGDIPVGDDVHFIAFSPDGNGSPRRLIACFSVDSGSGKQPSGTRPATGIAEGEPRLKSGPGTVTDVGFTTCGTMLPANEQS